MANAVIGNKIYVDSTGALTTARTKVAYVIFTSNVAGDSITLKETSGGNEVLTVKAANADETIPIDVSNVPMVFQNGIYVSALSAGAVATLITTNSGG